MDWKTLFLTAEGRIGRRDFWIGFVLIFVASMVLSIIPVIGQIAGLLLIWPQICIHAKRLHDMGRSAWLMLVPFAVSLVCAILAMMTGGMAMMASGGDGPAAWAGAGMAMLFLGLAVLVGLVFLLWVGLTPTQPGENRYGPHPRRLVGGDAPTVV